MDHMFIIPAKKDNIELKSTIKCKILSSNLNWRKKRQCRNIMPRPTYF